MRALLPNTGPRACDSVRSTRCWACPGSEPQDIVVWSWYRRPESRQTSGGVRLSTVVTVGSGQLRWVPAGLRVRMRVHTGPTRRLTATGLESQFVLRSDAPALVESHALGPTLAPAYGMMGRQTSCLRIALPVWPPGEPPVAGPAQHWLIALMLTCRCRAPTLPPGERAPACQLRVLFGRRALWQGDVTRTGGQAGARRRTVSSASSEIASSFGTVPIFGPLAGC
jgi:hypothetical protein